MKNYVLWHKHLHKEEDCPHPEICEEVNPEFHDWPDDSKACPHFTPEWWEKRGFKRNWGDAAVMTLDEGGIEILRREGPSSQEGVTEVAYIILNLKLRRPVEIYAHYQSGSSWGGY